MRIGPHRGSQVDCNGGQSLPKLRICVGMNHLPLEPNLLELLAVPMGAVNNSMAELKGETDGESLGRPG